MSPHLPEPNANPFPGLRPFKSDEDVLFFGREGQSDDILQRLRQNRFVAVVGTSGSGKSSLIRAGLLPSLHGGFMAHAGSDWRVVIMRPGQTPIVNLTRALCAATSPAETTGAEQLDALFVEASLRRGSLGLIEAVRQSHLGPDSNLLIVVDQMEELFRYAQNAEAARSEDEAAAFVKLLLEAVRQTSLPIYVVITMRSDYIGDCARFRDLPEAVNQGLYLIPRMTRSQQREAITGPVAVAGAQIAPRLVNRLLNDAGDNPDRLPILQHALMRTWDQWSRDHTPGEPLDLRHYEAVGGMAEALSRHADEAFDELPGARHRELARRLFQSLTEKAADHREVRRPIQVFEIIAVAETDFEQLRETVDCFRARSFLTPSSDVVLDEQSVIDISHESLIRGWQRLNKWVEEESASATTYHRLAETAALYEQGRAGLWDDPDLQMALSWREKEHPNEAWARRYHPAFLSAMAFLDASVAARNVRRKAKEQSAAEQLRRARRAASVIAAALVVAVGLLMYAWYENKRAGASERKALASEQQARSSEEQARASEEKALASEQKALANAKMALANEDLARANASRALDAQQQADQKTREAQAVASDMADEVLRNREQSLSHLDKLETLADQVSNHSSPAVRIWAGRNKELALSEQGNHQAAIQQLNSILEADPRNVLARSSRAYEYVLVGDAEKAIQDVAEYLRWDPRSHTAYLNRAIALAMQKQYEQALKDVRQQIQVLDASDFGTYDSEIAPDIQWATKHKTLSLDGSDYLVGLWYEIAVLDAFSPEGGTRFVADLKAADQEAARHHHSVNAYLIALNWAWLHRQDADYGGYVASGALWERAAAMQARFASWALESYRKFDAGWRKDPRHRYPVLAHWVSQELGSGKLSASASAATLQAPPTLRELALEAQELDGRISRTNLVQLGEVRRRLDEAIRAADPKLDKEILVRLLVRRAKLDYDAKDPKGVLEDCDRIVKLDPNVGDAYYYRALAETDDDAKIRDYEQSLKCSPLDLATLRSLSDLLKKKDPARALVLLETNVRVDPDSAAIRSRMAVIQLQMNRNQDALSSLNEAISIQPEDLSLYDQRKLIEIALHRSSRSVELHLAAGYRSAADELRREGKDSAAMNAYMKSLETVFHLQPGDQDFTLESEMTVRTISDFLETRYSREEARRFWRTLASSGSTRQLQSRAQTEIQRLQP